MWLVECLGGWGLGGGPWVCGCGGSVCVCVWGGGGVGGMCVCGVERGVVVCVYVCE